MYRLFISFIFILLSRENIGGTIFWTNPHSILWLLTTEFTAFSKPPSRDNHSKVPYPSTQQRIR